MAESLMTDPDAWRKAIGVLKDLAPGVPSELLIRWLRDGEDVAAKAAKWTLDERNEADMSTETLTAETGAQGAITDELPFSLMAQLAKRLKKDVEDLTTAENVPVVAACDIRDGVLREIEAAGFRVVPTETARLGAALADIEQRRWDVKIYAATYSGACTVVIDRHRFVHARERATCAEALQEAYAEALEKEAAYDAALAAQEGDTP